ncbi:SDR family NAD(P)-dependent oxidoreductase [Candidatus Enterococcus ferrettii]|uniref:Short-chain dehydrogenase n=1 Tax=Candidatus Enterococcus ferrettii TaxID=2815324 RepID=A0ABV0EPH3_9ENTE|nr:SDR family NAD(P)-dependent oxidoreductase [Enterococcus sp. 665A]MBO1343136.1 SDR family NAD(P)-dependent oxidoreductase [Enterococcus sp. 665A]
MKKMVIFGAGSGLGMSLAKKFGTNNYEIVLLARSSESLKQYCAELTAMNIKASYYVADAVNEKSVAEAFTKLCEEHGHIDLFIYNVGFLKPNRLPDLTQEELLTTFQMDVTSSLLATQIITSKNDPEKNTAMLYTGGGLALFPEKSMATLSIGKAGLRSLVHLLAQEFEDSNTFISTVTICGGIQPNTHFDPDVIAAVYWKTVQEGKQVEVVYK